MQQQPKFLQEYQKAQKRYKTNRIQAISILKVALQSPFDSDNSQHWYNYFTMRIELAGWMRDQNQTMFQESNAILTKVITQIKNPSINDKVQSHDLYKIKFSAFQNYAKLLIKQAPIDIQNDNYQKYRIKMNGAYSYFRQAQCLLLQKMRSQINRHGFVKDTEAEWYIRYLSNINQFLLAEAEYFKDSICMNNIFHIAEKAQQFYDLQRCKNEKKRYMQSHLHRCYYYKAVILRMKNKTDQALSLFLKVFKFQKGNGQFEDAEQSRDQILKILMDKNQISKAYSYAKQDKTDFNIIVKHIQIRRQKIRTALLVPNHEIIQKKNLFKEILAELEQQQHNKYRYDYQMIDNLVEKIMPHFDSNQDKALLYYYWAEANKEMQNYEKSHNMIKASLRIPISNQFDRINYMIEQIQILVKWRYNQNELSQLVIKVQKQINLQMIKCINPDYADSLNRQKQDFQSVLKQWKKIKAKANENVNYQFHNQEQNQLLQELKRMQGTYIKTVQQDKNKFILHDYYKNEPQDMQQKNQIVKTTPAVPNKHNQKVYILNPEDQYSKKCKQKNIPQRAEIKEFIKKSQGFNPFKDMLNISYEQMQVLLGIIKTQNLDLRNHQINQSLMQKLLSQYDHNIVKKFKISCSGGIQMETLLQIISKMTQLTYLSFLDFHSQQPSNFRLLQIRNQQKMDIQYQQPKSLVHTIYLLGKDLKVQLSESLRVLKLKYCNLLDGHLPEMNLKNYRNLKQVSLSHNLLQGKQLHHLFTLSGISAINISDNPLFSLDIDRWKNRFSQNDFVLNIKLRNIKFGQKLRQDLKLLIYRVQLLDLSESENLPELFGEIVQRYWQSGLQITKLNKLVLKNIDLDSIDILKFFQFFGRSKIIDFRGCKFNLETKRMIEDKRYQQLDLIIRISQKQSQNFTFKKFRLGSSNCL